MISKKEIGNYQMLKVLFRQKMLNQQFKKFLIYDISGIILLQAQV